MLKLYDTLTRQVSEVQPVEPGVVKMYTCGPTVYRDVHIGNLRSFLMADCIRRVLEAQGISVQQVKNITDVGHMRQQLLEEQEDKVIEAAVAEGKTPQEIAAFYTERFREHEWKLNILPADHFPTASDHVEDMIVLVEGLLERGYAYEVEGNVYYEVASFPTYGQLSGNTAAGQLKEGVRIEADPLKRDPRDFTLWKLAEPGRELKWPSPWGEGFPGWHIECSAMSMKYLGERFDLHTGGVDNVFPHHEAEIAQSEGFTGAPVVGQWSHGQHLLADGAKMSKSLGNSFTLPDIEARGIDPLAFRYLCLTVQFRTRLNFSFSSLRAAERALLRLRGHAKEWTTLSDAGEGGDDVRVEWEERFVGRVNDNLDMPGALAMTWRLVRSGLPAGVKLGVLSKYDEVLGLGLFAVSQADMVPGAVSSKADQRSGIRLQVRSEQAAAESDNRRVARKAAARVRDLYAQADSLRDEVYQAGFVVEDTGKGSRLRAKYPWEFRQDPWQAISSHKEVASLLDTPDTLDFTIGLVAGDYVDDVCRCVQSALRWAGDRPVEVVVLDNGSSDVTGEWLEETASKDHRVRVIHADHVFGEGAAKNIVLKQSQGRTILLFDTSVEVLGDVFGPIDALLDDDSMGVVGPYGLRTDDLHHFHDQEASESGDVDAVQAYCFAFRRSRIADVGLMRESFRFYRNLDLDYSFQFKDRGYRVFADPTWPLMRHEHRVWDELGEREREELSGKNYRRFLEKWRDRPDLLVAGRTAVPQ